MALLIPVTFDLSFSKQRDAVDLPEYGELPEIDLFQTVLVLPGALNPFFQNTFSRYRSTARPVELTNRDPAGGAMSVKFSNHPGGGTGGTCYGDSGGPQFFKIATLLAVLWRCALHWSGL